MTLQDFLAKITGQSDRLDAVAVKLESAFETISAKDNEIATLKAQLESAPKPEAITTLESKVSTLEAEKTDLEGKLAKLPAAVNDKAAEIVAANGHAAVDTTAVASADNGKSKIEALEAKLKAETDPFKRTALYREHKAEIAKAKTLLS